MEKFRIFGGYRLSGTVTVSGAKNAALPCLAATLLTREPVRLSGLPRVRDILTMEKVLRTLGEHCQHDNGTTTVVMGQATATHAPYELVRTMRASVLVLGPLLASRRQARVALPGGCAIGARPIDFHLSALARLGADIRVEHGDVVAEAPRGLFGAEIAFPRVTVTGTENLLMAATLARGRTVLSGCAREPEVVDLAAMLTLMGARISGAGTDVIEVEGVDQLTGCSHTVIPDRIEAGTYLLAALMVGDGVRIEGCVPEHLSAVLEVLGSAGAQVEVQPQALVVPRQQTPLRAFTVSTQEYPGFPTDLQAQAMALATQAEGRSEIVENIFENRFQHVLELKRLGADISVEGRKAVVRGPTKLQGTTVMASDLRASAALVLAGLAAEGETVVDRIYHLDRGYETMEVKLSQLGARIERFNPGPFL
ncbi:UDP-N-acetylglucosamine 1-carboxyvinyltransferase [Thermoanaerobaculum aquaticum]|uniref:UDP-N-acetylglucosamine 1-carboxyvinyltransferase n=1 Tax=Thermoanaerobaculum aquaticum TaxID=1312852 RepID=A0A062XXT5_9BACT|nr:UDP-N-acetylglucosamine 1-carboxyvinyltransferase [Thermoanaerobaculum aquaticum]KDA52891.1 UDP-N-acetylglucosamine 1-carboxyvinyltransferase [Thermoanaerobaculum aquaticum]